MAPRCLDFCLCDWVMLVQEKTKLGVVVVRNQGHLDLENSGVFQLSIILKLPGRLEFHNRHNTSQCQNGILLEVADGSLYIPTGHGNPGPLFIVWAFFKAFCLINWLSIIQRPKSPGTLHAHTILEVQSSPTTPCSSLKICPSQQ